MSSESEYEIGLKVRRTVLGDEYVDQVLRETTALTRDFQQLLTKYCWGSVWSRRGLSWRDRSLINIAMLVALNRPHELRMHIKGAVRNGCSAAEISEVLLQTAIYCGIPAGATGYAIAAEVLGELGVQGDGASGDSRPAASAAGRKDGQSAAGQSRALSQRDIGYDNDNDHHHNDKRNHARRRTLRRKPAVR